MDELIRSWVGKVKVQGHSDLCDIISHLILTYDATP